MRRERTESSSRNQPLRPKPCSSRRNTELCWRTGITFPGCPWLLPHSSWLQTLQGEPRLCPAQSLHSQGEQPNSSTGESHKSRLEFPKAKAKQEWFGFPCPCPQPCPVPSSKFLFDPQGLCKLQEGKGGITVLCPSINHTFLFRFSQVKVTF